MELSFGKLGELFTSLAFASALVSMISFFLADRQGVSQEKRSWERMGKAGFMAHALGIFGIIATLFYLIYSHNYAYHYVWSHSSNELPVHFMISCFWEGQEGSFLLWSFWHSVLGLILLFRGKEWRNGVLAVISSVELILSSMLLGVYLNENWVSGLLLIVAIIPALYFGYGFFRQRSSLPLQGNFHLASLFVAGAFVILLLRNQLGFSGLTQTKLQLETVGFWAFVIVGLAYAGFFLFYLSRSVQMKQYQLLDVLAGIGLVGVILWSGAIEVGQWKLGSTPFVMLKDVFPDNPVYQENPNFVPINGSGLNPLLQNYWMVIHPPTLFLGFAATVVPFAFVMAGLLKGDYTRWIKPAMPWMSFAVMILGVGIIMGGYWAYETLNFGGYWNWDPVENSSLVPWLCGVAALHTLLIYRKTKSYLKLSMIMVVGTFLLVLYSTFLTRSGILGDTSVHTFTDLGLSGQLLILLAIFSSAVFAAMWVRWKAIPQRPDESKVWSAEFMLFLGILVFVFSGLVITMVTSIPVFNEIFNMDIAPPVEVQLFYYRWNVWFAILFGLVSGIGQFLWWKTGTKALRPSEILTRISYTGIIAGLIVAFSFQLWMGVIIGLAFALIQYLLFRSKDQPKEGDAIFRPFLAMVVIGSLTVLGLLVSDMDFVYDAVFAEDLQKSLATAGALGKGLAYLKFAVLSLADEILLFTSLFAVFANLDVLISLLMKNRKGLKVMGGTVVHLGFGLMLLGMLFSSGYDEIVSVNLHPSDLDGSTMPDQEKQENVLLPKGREIAIKDYTVTYTGAKQAQSPVSDLLVVWENVQNVKVQFDDITGDRFAVVLPRSPYLKAGSAEAEEGHSPATPDPMAKPKGEVDLVQLETLLNQDLASFGAGHINNRTLYGLEFQASNGREEPFVLYPEAEINEEMQSIISHPGRRVFWDRDLYVYTSSLPNPEAMEPEFFSFSLKVGDTIPVGNAMLWLAEIRNLTKSSPELEKFEIAAAAHIVAFAGQDTFLANPIFTIAGNRPGMIPASIEELGMEFVFVGVSPEENLIHIQVRYVDPNSDFVVIKAISKPFINLLWLGTFILTAGFLISIFRRIQESRLGKETE